MEFVTPSATPVAIALVDASYSVKDTFVGSTSIFNKFCDILKSLPHPHYYIQFWSSQGALGSEAGTLKFPFKVERAQLSQPFAVCTTKEFRSTFPHLGFVGIDEWLQAGTHTVYLLTDGAMSSPSSPDLKNAVSRLMTTFPDVQLHLITVEAREIQFQNVENMQCLVGGDVYHILVNNHMTHLLSSFTSYTRNHPDGYKHLDRVRAPPGYLSFRNKLFREVDLPKFFVAAQSLVAQIDPQNEEALLLLLQDLVTPVARAQRDKPASMVRAMTANFASLFVGTCINSQIATFLLSSGCSADLGGQVQVLADFRRQLKDAFKSAQLMLCANVANATGLDSHEKWMSLPMPIQSASGPGQSLLIVVGPPHVLTQEVKLQGSLYKQGVVQLGDTLVGAIPMVVGELAVTAPAGTELLTGGLTEQCTRQWVRALAAQTYGVNATSDVVVYLIMALHAQVAASPGLDDGVKKAWANLAKIMLRKKRVNSTETEWDRLERGEFPLPNNGSLDSLKTDLATVLRLLTRGSGPQAPSWQDIWRALCTPLGLVAQLRHCVAPGESPDSPSGVAIAWPPIEGAHTLPLDDLEYKCGITMESTALTGGFKLRAHVSRTGHCCSPRLVFSVEGMDALLSANAASVCPVCYAAIDRDSFAAVAPATLTTTELPTFAGNPLLERPVAQAAPVPSCAAAQPPPSTQRRHRKPDLAVSFTDATKGIVLLKGTLGCGKSTFVEKVKAALKSAQAAATVAVLSIDKHIEAGLSQPDAFTAASAEAQAAAQNGTHYVIVDMCFCKSMAALGVDAGNVPCCTIVVNQDGQANNLKEFLAWSWRNVARSRLASNAFGTDAHARAPMAWTLFDRKARIAYGKARVRAVLKELPREEGPSLNALADAFARELDAISARQVACVLARFRLAA